jgi:transcriptional regulator with XRE-family HTH domain
MAPTDDLAWAIKTARLKLGWTQRDLAANVGVALRTVQAWELGESVPRTKVAILQEVLKTSFTTGRSVDDQDGLAVVLPPEALHGLTELERMEGWAKIRADALAAAAEVRQRHTRD